MAGYPVGQKTRSLILNAYRELFYKKGYKKTTYVNILDHTGLNQGLITYYFKSKKAIAGEIHSDFRIQIKGAVKQLFNELNKPYDLRVATSLEQIIYTRIKFSDEKLKKFIYEISVEGVYMEYELLLMKEFWDMHVREYNLPLSDNEIKMIQVANSSLTLGITMKMIEGYLQVSVEDFIRMRIRLMFQSLGLKEEEISDILEKSLTLYDRISVELQDYFRIEVTPLL